MRSMAVAGGVLLMALSAAHAQQPPPAVPLSAASLVQRLDDPNPFARRSAIANLARLGPAAQNAAPKLVAALHDPVTRREATGALAEIGAGAVPAIAQALADSDPDVRSAAAQALAEIGPDAKAAVAPLITALSDPAVHRDAVDALAAIGPDALIGLLSALGEDAEPLYNGAIEAIGKLGRSSDAATAELVRLLTERNEKLRTRAARAIALIGPSAKPALPDVVKALASPQSAVRIAVVSAIEGIGGREADAPLIAVAATDADPAVREAAEQSFARMGPFVVDDLIAAIKNPDPAYRRAAASIVGRMGAEASNAVGPLGELFKEKDDALRIVAVRAMGDIGPNSRGYVGPMIPFLTDKNEDLRRATLKTLGRIGQDSAGAVNDIVKLLADVSIRPLAIETLGQIGSNAAGAVPVLLPLLKQPDVELQRVAIVALGRIGGAAHPAMPDMLHALQTDYPTLRIAAAEALGRIGAEPEIVTNLLKALGDPDPFVGVAAGESLARYGQPSVAPLILALQDKQTAHAAAAALVIINQPASIDLIAALKLPATRTEAAWALSRIGPEYLGNLVNALRDEHPPLIPEQTAAVLIAERGDVAAPLVMQMIRDGAPRVRSVGVDTLARLAWRYDNAPAEFQKMLADGDKNVRIAIVQVLARIGPRAEFTAPDVLLRLKDPDPDVRRATAEALGYFHAVDVPTRLLEAAALDTERPVRAAAAESLARLGALSALPLVAIAKDPDSRFRLVAATALGQTHVASDPVIDALAGLLGDDRDETRRAAAESLAELGPATAPKTSARLVALLSDPGESTRLAAAVALRRIHGGDIADLPALRAAIADRSELVGNSAAGAVADVLTRLQPQLKKLTADQLKMLGTELAALTLQLHGHGGKDLLALQVTEMQKGLAAIGTGAAPSSATTIPDEKPTEPPIAAWMKWLIVVGVYLAVMIALWWVLLIVAPASLLTLDRWASVLRWPTLLGFFRYNGGVLDAWVSRHAATAAPAFEKQTTVSDRAVYVELPIKVGGQTVPASPDQLRLVLSPERARVVIRGEAGSGCTSLACQIGRWALDKSGAKRMGVRRAIPVLIEHDMAGGERNQRLIDAVEAKLREELGAAVAPDRALLLKLLQKRRVLVIVDAFEQMNDKSRAEVRASVEVDGMNLVVVTSDGAEDLGGAATIETLSVTPEMLVAFFDAYLQQRGVAGRFTEDESASMRAGLRPLLLGGGSPAAIRMYVDAMIAAKNANRSLVAPRTMPELLAMHLRALELKADDPEWREPAAILRDCRLMAWECIKKRYRPDAAPRLDIQTALAGGAMLRQVVDKRLKVLESQGLIRPTGPDKTKLRFAVGLVCEQLAAAQIVEQLESSVQRWQSFLGQLDAAKPSRGFLMAIRSWAAQDETRLPPGVLEALDRRFASFTR